MQILANFLIDGIWPAAYLLLVGLVPLVFFTWLIHVFEKLILGRLVQHFGWHSVMLTGWLGTPIHELSHALMCAIFQHDIVEMKLFQPDRKSGRLGYVVHTWQKGNLYQEFGGFFIGIAPLLGGTTVLLLLMMIFFPDVGRSSLFNVDSSMPLWNQIGTAYQALFAGLFDASNLATIRLWLFLYLVICVGSHMAPSLSDYEGAMKGGLMLLVILVIASVALSLVETSSLLTVASPVIVPVITAMLAVITLCVIATVVVYLVTESIGLIGGIKSNRRRR